MTLRTKCWTCGRRFFAMSAEDVTCSDSCEACLNQKREAYARAKRLCDAVFGKKPTRLPVRYALAETRASIAAMRRATTLPTAEAGATEPPNKSGRRNDRRQGSDARDRNDARASSTGACAEAGATAPGSASPSNPCTLHEQEHR